jgi:hypothetical protein
MEYYTFQIPAETVGNFVYLGLIGVAIGAFYLFANLMDYLKDRF